MPVWKRSNVWKIIAWIFNFICPLIVAGLIMVTITLYNRTLYNEWKQNIPFVESNLFRRTMNSCMEYFGMMSNTEEYIKSDNLQNTIVAIDTPYGIVTNGDKDIVTNWVEQCRQLDTTKLPDYKGFGETIEMPTPAYGVSTGEEQYLIFAKEDGIIYQLAAIVYPNGEKENYYASSMMIDPMNTLLGIRGDGTIYTFLDDTFSGEDDLKQMNIFYSKGKILFQAAFIICIACVVLYSISLIYLIAAAGHKKGSNEIHLTRYDKIPGELIAAVIVAYFSFLPAFMIYIVREYAYIPYLKYDIRSLYNMGQLLIAGIPFLGIYLITYLVLMTWIMRIVRRKKVQVTYWDTSIFHIISNKISIFYNARKEIGRVFLLLIGGIGVFFISMLLLGSDGIVALIGLIGVITTPIIVIKTWIQQAIWRDQIYEGIDHIAQGDVGYKIKTNRMKSNEKKAAEQINHLGEGLYRAVTEATKNERLKSELITNVSHDIKTPLTSIINYVDLIKREDVENEKIKEYIKILDEKSQRLKHLTEDLVEASKANTGNLTLNMEKIDFMQLIYQTLGEFQDKFEERQLITVTKLDKSPIWIYADGRRVWRVMENLLQNVYKYAMPQTRVYIESVTTATKTMVTIKNISENPLNIPASELTERFIRGDVARTTEGSGLGLSIAKSLTELMNGTFELYLDGDLFRATVSFDRFGVEQEEKEEDEADAFAWEDFIKKSDLNRKENERQPEKESRHTEKKRKITLFSMWKDLGGQMKNFNLKKR